MEKNTEKYLFGLMNQILKNGIYITHIEEPYMIIEAADEAEARKIYCNVHDAVNHDTTELIAKKCGTIWWKITKYFSHEEIASIISKIE